MPDDNQQWLNPRPPANLPATPPPDRPKPPPPPPPEITIRTMSSDLESLKETGGTTPAPKPFTPPELKKGWTSPTPPPPPPPAGGPPKITPAEFGEPKKSEAAPPSGLIEEEGGSKGKKIALWAGTSVIVVGAGLAGYYIIFPLLFPPQAPPPPPAVTQPPTEVPISAIPVVEPPTALAPHQSLLKSTDAISNAQTSADLASLSNTLQQEAQKSNPGGSLVELMLSDANGQLPSSSVLSALLPEISPEAMKNLFEDDFTLALYYDANGSWPAYIFKLKAEASQVEAQTEVNKLESSPNLRNFFASDPGTQTASFKTGQVNGLATRYVTFSKQGAALNVAWSGDKLVISTSYNGLKKILGNF